MSPDERRSDILYDRKIDHDMLTSHSIQLTQICKLQAETNKKLDCIFFATNTVAREMNMKEVDHDFKQDFQQFT